MKGLGSVGDWARGKRSQGRLGRRAFPHKLRNNGLLFTILD